MPVIDERKHDASNVLAPGQAAVGRNVVTYCPPDSLCPQQTEDLSDLSCTSAGTCTVKVIYDPVGQMYAGYQPPDQHWAIILVLAMAIIWMWLAGTFMAWVGATQLGWHRRGCTGTASHRFMWERWRWKFAAWPLWPFRQIKP